MVDRTYTDRLVNQTYLNRTQKHREDVVGYTVSDVMENSSLERSLEQLRVALPVASPNRSRLYVHIRYVLNGTKLAAIGIEFETVRSCSLSLQED